jgi:hypothetical protein
VHQRLIEFIEENGRQLQGAATKAARGRNYGSINFVGAKLSAFVVAIEQFLGDQRRLA